MVKMIHLASRLYALDVEKVIDQIGQPDSLVVEDSQKLAPLLRGEVPLQHELGKAAQSNRCLALDGGNMRDLATGFQQTDRARFRIRAQMLQRHPTDAPCRLIDGPQKGKVVARVE